MRKDDLRCCLAVAEDVWRDATGSTVNGVEGMPSKDCSDWFGWGCEVPSVDHFDFVQMNDMKKLSHSKIAEIIRANLGSIS